MYQGVHNSFDPVQDVYMSPLASSVKPAEPTPPK